MEIILVLLVSVAVLIVSLYLYRIASGTLVLLNIPNIFFYFYVLMVYVGSILMYLGLDMASLYLGATDKIILTKMLLSTMSGMVLIPCGMILANMVFRFDAKQSFDQYWTAKVERIVSPRDTYVFPFMIIVVAISIVALVMYLRQLSTIPIVALFGGASPAELAYLRSQATNNFGNHIHRYSLFYQHIIPHLSRVVFVYYLSDNKSLWIRFLTFFMICLSLFTQSMALYKEPVVFYLVSLFIIYFYVKSDKYNVGKTIKIAVLSFLMITIIYVLVMNTGGRSFFDTMLLPLNRMLVGQIRPLYFYYAMIPQTQNFLLGKAFPNPGGLLPFEPYPLVVEVMNFMYPHLRNSNIVGTAPTVFWGEVYANFGYFSIFPSMVVFGFLIQTIHIIFVKRIRKTAFSLATYVYLMILIKNLNGMPLSYLLVNIYIISIILVNMFIRVMGRSLSKI